MSCSYPDHELRIVGVSTVTSSAFSGGARFVMSMLHHFLNVKVSLIPAVECAVG